MIVKHFIKNSIIDNVLLSVVSDQIMFITEVFMQVLII